MNVIEFLEVFLPICVYILLIILLVVGIILGVRLIGAMDKIDAILMNVENKVNSFNGFFSALGYTTEKITSISTHLADIFSGVFGRLSRKKRKKLEEESNE